MSALTFFDVLPGDLAHAKHDFSAHTLKVALTNTAPVATNTVLADITQIGAGNGYSSGGATAALSSETAGPPYVLKLSNVTFTASGGSIGPFQYAVLYNSTTAGGPLIGWSDYGSAVTLSDGQQFVVAFNAVTGALQVGVV